MYNGTRDNETTNETRGNKMNKMSIYITDLGENANFELYEQCASEVFGYYGSIVCFNFSGVNNPGTLSAELFADLLAETWDRYCSHKYWY